MLALDTGVCYNAGVRRYLLPGLLVASLFAQARGAGEGLPEAARARLGAPRRWALGWAASRPSSVLAASDVSGRPQLYTVDLAKGRWHRVSDEPAGKSWGALSPDGESVVFLKDVMGSEIGQLFRASARGGKEEPLVPGFPAKSVTDVRWGDSGRNVYFDASDRSGFGVYQFSLGGRRAFTLAFSKHEIVGVLPSPDERFLAYRARSAAGDFDVRVVDLGTGGEAGALAVAEGSLESFGTWAADGARGRLLVASDATGVSKPGVWDVASSSLSWLVTGLEGEVVPLDWFPGGEDVLLRRRLQGIDSLWRWSPAAPPARIEGVQGRVAWARVRPDGAVWVGLESSERPPDVLAAAGGKAEPALPQQGKRRGVSGHAARGVALESANGTALAGRLIVPAGAPPPGGRGALIWLGDLPGVPPADEWDPVLLGLADEGMLVLALGYSAGPPGLQDLAGARDWLVREHGVAASSVAVGGSFYGGSLALLALGKQPELWAAGAAAGAVADWARIYEDGAEPVRAWCRRVLGGEPEAAPERYQEASPAAFAFTIRAPVLLVHAESDSRAPLPQIEAFAERLKDAGKSHRLTIVKGGRATAAAENQGRFLEDFLNLIHQAGLGLAKR